MDQPKPTNLIKYLNILVVTIIVLVPFQGFLTVWAGSSLGGYSLWRLWDEVILLIGCGLAAVLLWHDRLLWRRLKKMHVVWLISVYGCLEIIIGLVALARHGVNAKALGYGLIVDLRFLLFFLLCLVVASKTDWFKSHWRNLLLLPALIVVVYGLIQHFFLPADFLRHFGYSLKTIVPYQTVNQNQQFIRAQSTLRGPNPLGAYLTIVLSVLTVLLFRAKDATKRVLCSGMIVATLGLLFFSYSRSAFVGAALAVVVIVAASLRSQRGRIFFTAAIGSVVIIGIISAVVLKQDAQFQNIIFHTSTNSSIKTTSDKNHFAATTQALRDVIAQPLGHGPGTSGPASFYNNHPSRDPENYYLQIAEQTGWLGLVIFLLINWLIGKELWHHRRDPLALIALSSLIGILCINLLLPSWTDDTLAYIWWGIAGIALSSTLSPKVRKSA
jgi:hypothetical protein